MTPRRTKYHPYSKKFPATDVMGTCPICKKEVLRGDGFVVEEKMFPKIEKIYIHHSKYDDCLQKHFDNQKDLQEKERKKNLGFPENPLDNFIKSYKKSEQ